MQTHPRRLPNPVQGEILFPLEEVAFGALDLYPGVPAEGATLVTLDEEGRDPGGYPPGTLRRRVPLPIASSTADFLFIVRDLQLSADCFESHSGLVIPLRLDTATCLIGAPQVSLNARISLLQHSDARFLFT